MRISVEFDSMEEFEAFRVSGKKTRSGKADKGEADDTPATTGSAPAPMQPPTGNAGGFPTASFAPPAGGAAPMGGGFPVAAAPQPAPEVVALVTRINTKVNDAIKAGATPADQALTWFRQQCGPEAANATMDQIQQHFLPKMAVPALEQIAKLMNA